MNELPDGWEEITLGEVCEVIGGATPKTKVVSYWGGSIPWITPADLSKHKGQFIERGERSLTQQGYDSCSTQLMPAGSVLFTSRAPIGYVAIAAKPVCTNQGFKSFIPPDEVLSQYLYWYLLQATPAIQGMGSGTTFKEISKKVASSIPFRMPSMPEQQRIVDAIEELFTRLDVIEPALKGLLDRLGVLRSAILADAFHTNRELPDGWEETMLSEIGKWGSGGTPKRTNDAFYENGTIPWVIIGDLDDSVVIETATLITEEALAQSSAKLVPQGAVLIAMYGSIGKLGITGRELATNQAIAFCVAHEGIDTRFLFWYLMSQRPYLAGAGKGATQKNISQTVLKTWPIRIAPLLEQQRIVGYLEAAFSRMDALEVTVRGLLERVGVFRQSVLAEAFAGRLVPQDPSDEPASALLERIRTDREAGPKKRGKVKA